MDNIDDLGARDGFMEVDVCFEACLTIAGSQNNCPANVDTSLKVIGNDAVAFTWKDTSGESASGHLNADVTTLLTVDVKQHAFVEEDPEKPIMVQLTGVDFLCENVASPPAECINRDKTFKISEEPTHGKLYTSEDVSTLIETYPVILSSDIVYFMPDADYYHADSHPLCFAGTKKVAFSKYPTDSFVAQCEGPTNAKVGLLVQYTESGRYLLHRVWYICTFLDCVI